MLDRVLNILLVFADAAGNYMFKVNNRSTRAWCEICSKLKIKTPEQDHQWRRSGVFIVNFEHTSLCSLSIVNFE